MHQSTQLLKIFIIYSREDVNALLEFKKSLAPLERRGEIEVWYDGEIVAGQEWQKAIKENLSVADIIVLFLSNDFFSSEYIEKEELRQALDRHERGEAVVTPVVLRHCLWQEHPQIESLQVLPDNAYPVFSKKHWDGPDEAFMNVASGIARTARDILKKRQLNDPEIIRLTKEELYIESKLKSAAEAYDKENFELAFFIFDRYKDNALFSAEFQYRLGRMYDMGQFVEVDYQQARAWYEKAAEKGDAAAMRNLGVLYTHGNGVIQDYEKAKVWYEKAAEKGDAGAMLNLGILYHNGQGVSRGYVKARAWYEKAAEKGDTGAMNNLGVLYENGLGVSQDYAKARVWYEKAAEKGDAQAMSNLGLLYHNGHSVIQDYAKAKLWYEKAAEKGNAAAMYNLGWIYEYGQGVGKDNSKAKAWYEKAHKLGYAQASEKLN